MHSHPIQIVLRADSAPDAPSDTTRHTARSRDRQPSPIRVALSHSPDDADRPSLPAVFACAVAFALFVALAMLAQVARAQPTPRTRSSGAGVGTPSASTGSAPASAGGSASGSAAGGSSNAASPKSPKRAASTDEESVGAALRRSADRHGLWGSVGVGRASAGLSCEACARETTRAYAFHGTVGVRLSSRFLVGAETFAWLDVIGGGVDRIARGTYLIARSYPFEGSPLFLHGGLGLAGFQVNDGEVAFTTRSPSLSIAAGYDWHLGAMTLTPSITAITSTGGRLNSDRTGNAITDNARLGLLRSSLALSWFR